MISLWFWQDDCDLTAFSDGFGGVVVLKWFHNDGYVRKGEISRGDHVLFDCAGYVLAIRRRRQKKIRNWVLIRK